MLRSKKRREKESTLSMSSNNQNESDIHRGGRGWRAGAQLAKLLQGGSDGTFAKGSKNSAEIFSVLLLTEIPCNGEAAS